MYLTNFGSRNRLKLVPRPCDARFLSYGPPSHSQLTKPPPPGDGPLAEPMCVSDRARHGLSFEGLYFSVRSRVQELWTKQVLDQYIKYRWVQRNRRAREAPPRARTQQHRVLSAFIRVCLCVGLRATPHVGGSVRAPHVLRVCDVMLLLCSACNKFDKVSADSMVNYSYLPPS